MTLPDESRVVFVGDFAICGSEFESRFTACRPDPWKPLKEQFGYDAAIVCNLECAFTQRTDGRPFKWANLRMAQMLHPLLEGVKLVVLANNHVGDFFHAGVIDTLAVLQAKSIASVGYGSCIRDALAMRCIDVGGKQLGIVAMCCPTTNSEFLATHSEPGIAPLAMDTLSRAIAHAKNECDALVVYMHWGREHVHDPSPDQLRLARHAIDSGADAIVGCHSHTIQSYEQYRGRWIFYGLGNYLFHPAEALAPQADGTYRKIPIIHQRMNRQSLAVAFRITSPTSNGRLELAGITPMEFGPEFEPRPIRQSDLTFDLARATKRLRRYAANRRAFLESRDEPCYRARWHNGAALAYWYERETIVAQPVNRVVGLAKRIVRPFVRIMRAALPSTKKVAPS